MNTEETNDVQISDDLDTFSAELFGQSPSTDPTEATEDNQDNDTSDDAPNELNAEGDTQGSDESDDDNDEGGSEDGDDSNEPDPKPKKNRFQERIDELTAKAREAERREQATLAKLEEIMQKLDPKEAPTNKSEADNDDGPKPTDVDENGDDKYPNGEFDPQYQADRVKYLFRKEKEADEAARAVEESNRKAAEQELQLQTEWNNKLNTARERYPDFQEKSESLVNSFSGLDEAYGNYLSTTIMSMEYGQDVLYYLASNPDEAKKIVNSGAAMATVALGRLESKFAFAEEQKQNARPKVSNAPTPPVVNKGSAPTKTTVNGDEDDLDLISAALFKRR